MRSLWLLMAMVLFSALSARSVSADGIDLKAMILMPGPVIEAHAKEENKCESCHSDFDKSAQDALCLDCHEDVALDRDQQIGFHGRAPNILDASCKSCHKEHKGRTFDSVPIDPDTFDHEHTDFSLSGKHRGAACEGCHSEAKLFREAPQECVACHEKQDPHRTALGDDCGACHKPQSWQAAADFDHSATDFPLQGRHESIQCSSCHAGEQFTFESTACISCHRVRDVHLGGFGEGCDSCHSQEEWSGPEFDHGVETDFKLTGAHSDQSCQACHHDSRMDQPPETECVACHGSIDVHAGRHGQECGSCHNTSQWTRTRFDHAKDTDWPLLARHKKLSCLQCHRGSLEDSLDTQCQACHSGDDVHRSEQLADCSTCHTPDGWKRTAGFDHELTRFPLEGMHAIAACQACHQNHEFQRTETGCVDCHRPDDEHESALGSACQDCHSPNGWSLWTFDHDKTTDFELTGAHADLSCGSCHQGDTPSDLAGTCAGCHAGDDYHGGGFGKKCERCHSNDSFGDVQWPD